MLTLLVAPIIVNGLIASLLLIHANRAIKQADAAEQSVANYLAAIERFEAGERARRQA